MSKIEATKDDLKGRLNHRSHILVWLQLQLDQQNALHSIDLAALHRLENEEIQSDLFPLTPKEVTSNFVD